MKKKNVKRKSFLKKILCLSSLCFLFLFLLYFIGINSIDPDFFIQDFKNKQGRVEGTFIAVEIIGAPNDPYLNVSTQCENQIPVVNLSWTEDIGTQTFEILRNGSTLVSGLTGTSYKDTGVNNNTTYSYQLIAHGSIHDAYSQIEEKPL